MANKTQQLQIRVTPEQKKRLKHLARRAGRDVSSYVLARALPPARARVEKIFAALRREEEPKLALAEFHDLLVQLSSSEFAEALDGAEVDGLSSLHQNYVAAMTELAAYRKGVAPPGWVAAVEPMETPYFAVPFRSLRPHLLRSSPVPFKRRNIFIDSTLGDRI